MVDFTSILYNSAKRTKFNRSTKEHLTDETAITSTYDATSQQLTMTDASGVTTNFDGKR